jgi:fluoride exporter
MMSKAEQYPNFSERGNVGYDRMRTHHFEVVERGSSIMEGFVHALIQFKGFFSDLICTLTETGRLLQPALKKLLLVMFGGSLGAASRYGVNLLTVKLWGTGFPWGTLTVNLVGCFLIGLLFSLADRVRLLTPDMRLLLITGYLGALTTFSSFALETVNAGHAGMKILPIANILVNNLCGLMLTYIGLWVGGLK